MEKIDPDKLENLRLKLSISADEFSSLFGVNKGNYSKIINRKLGISRNVTAKIIEKFPDEDLFINHNPMKESETIAFLKEQIRAKDRQLEFLEKQIDYLTNRGDDKKKSGT